MTSVTDTPLSEADLVTAAIPTAVAEEIARLQAENAALRETNAVLLARIAELERRLGLNWEQREAPIQRWAEEATPDDEFAGIFG